VRVGISLPQIGPQAGAENLRRVARRAEELGYDSVWVLERLLWPVHPQEPYPATADGELPEAYQVVLDPLETLIYVAAHTTRVRLGTSVIVLPYHTPVELARRVATLDVLSGGRAILGVGVGWSRDEFEAAGVPFARRGARTDELLRALIEIWTRDPVGFEGEFYRIPESRIGPKPVQKPYPPIYVAGFGTYALERAVRYGRGWNPAGFVSFEWLTDMIRQLREVGEREGKTDLEVVLRVFPVVSEALRGPERAFMTGTLGAIRDDLRRLEELGVSEVICHPPELGWTESPGIDAGLERMEQLFEISR